MSSATLVLPSAVVELRRAVSGDVRAIVELLAADQVGASRENPDAGDGLRPYLGAFEAIDADAAHLLLVAVAGEEIIGTLQLSVLPGLARRGALRGQLEAVRVREDRRGCGLGAAMVRWAIEEARRRGCALVQLTTDKTRLDAHRFYDRLGFVASHEGMKLRF